MPRPQTRTERRRAAKVRRSRVMLAGAAAVSVLIVAAWFPVSALYHQRQELASTGTQLAELRQQDRALAQERKNLSSSAEIDRIARQEYDLVKPGQQAYEVLPASKAGSGADAPDPGDPGLAAPVTPSGESELPAGSAHPASGSSGVNASGGTAGKASSTGSSGGSAGDDPAGSSSVLGRILQTLEFWR